MQSPDRTLQETIRNGPSAHPVLARLIALCVLFLSSIPFVARAQTADFSGNWQTYWRTGSAVLSLSQEDGRVTGTYQPGDGTVRGVVEGQVLSGEWVQPGASGTFVFALSQDRQVLTGRFGNGEYWNGVRDTGSVAGEDRVILNNTPRETLRSLLLAANFAIYSGNMRPLRRVDELLIFAGQPTTTGNEARRRNLLFDLLDISTLRIMDVPEAPENPADDTLRFSVGPAAVSEKMEIEFRRDASGRWRIVVPDEATLSADRDRLLAATGYDSMANLDEARVDSPRAVLRDFILGTRSWEEGGRERALAALDLTGIPEHSRDLEGPIYADFIRRIINRVGFIIWQEIPDNPNRSVPYVWFQHPAGNITIARVPQPPLDRGSETRDTWKISAGTLATAPALLEAMQDLPPLANLAEPEPLSPFFRLRERVRTAAPGLLGDWGYLEGWQWIGFVAAGTLAALAYWVVAAATRGLSALWPALSGMVRLALPLGLTVAAMIVQWAVARLGMTQAGLPMVGALAGTLLILSLAFLAFRIATLVGRWFLATAQKTTSYMDEIAASLGTGLVKLAIVVLAIVAVADVVGLPYEGVLTGLGVGGVAIAFAARDTVSNMMGGGLLMADRPFQRGDLIELDGTLATVEQVGLRSTKLRSLDDTLLHVPNNQLSDRTIANWGKRRRRKLTMSVGLTYDTPREKLDTFVRRLREVVLTQRFVDADDIYIGLQGFGASSIDIQLLCHFRVPGYAEQVEAQHALMMDIIALADDVGVEFAFPTRTLHFADGLEKDQITKVGTHKDVKRDSRAPSDRLANADRDDATDKG